MSAILRLRARHFKPNCIPCWGDSLTFGAGASDATTKAYPPIAGNAFATPRTAYNRGVGGQTSTQVAVRQGGVATTATISGGQIPTSGGVTVTFPSGYEPCTSQSPVGGIAGTISGVYGFVTYSGGVLTFTRAAAGSAVNVASAQFIPDLGFMSGAAGQVFWVGRNNFASLSQIQSDLTAMAATVPGGRFLMLTVTNKYDGTENSGSADYNQIIADNSMILSGWPSNSVDIRALLVAASGGSNDAINPSWGNGDGTHLNDTAYAYIGAQVQSWFAAKGW
jgi:lysophospholipase L1-like esterase